MIKEKLSVRDLFVLVNFVGREVGETLNEYEIEDCGRDYLDRVDWLIIHGYLTYADPPDALQALTIPELKEILRANGQKLSGKKDDLIARIIETCTDYDVPKVYAATERGNAELEARDYFFENKRMCYDFLNSEIESAEADCAKPLLKLFLRDRIKHAAASNFSRLAYTYAKYGKYLRNHGEDDDALRSYLEAIYIRLSGMGDCDSIIAYEDLEATIDDELWRQIDSLRTALNLSDEELAARFYEAQKSTRPLTFSYFTPKEMLALILDKLHGQENLFERYKPQRQIEKRNSFYKVETSSGSGCLVVVLMVLILIIGGCMRLNHNLATPEEFVRDFKAASLNPSTLQELQQVTGDVFIRISGDMEAVLIIVRPHNGKIGASAVQDALTTYGAAITASDSTMTSDDVKKIFAGLGLDEPPDRWQKDETVERGGHRYIVSELSGGEKILAIMKE